MSVICYELKRYSKYIFYDFLLLNFVTLYLWKDKRLTYYKMGHISWGKFIVQVTNSFYNLLYYPHLTSPPSKSNPDPNPCQQPSGQLPLET